MEFSGQYLTYLEYKALGGTLDRTPFDLLEFEARNQIDLRTHNRLVGQEEIPQKVKICEYELINKMQNYAISEEKIDINGNVKSVNTDGYSESYVTASEVKNIVESHKAELDDIMLTGLYGVVVNNVAILYDGVC